LLDGGGGGVFSIRCNASSKEIFGGVICNAFGIV
jgi:hypothetical protein